MKEKRFLIFSIVDTIEIRRGKIVGYLICHNKFISNVIQGKIERKKEGDEDTFI